MTAILLNYDEHYAECPQCGHCSSGTCADSRANLPGFDFDYSKQVFICDDCKVECIAYYEVYNGNANENDPEEMTDITQDILPAQHCLNLKLNKERQSHD